MKTLLLEMALIECEFEHHPDFRHAGLDHTGRDLIDEVVPQSDRLN
jgi:hypothetical protein